MHHLQAATAPLTTPVTQHVPHSSSSGACKGRGCSVFSGDGSGDYFGILAAKSQQSQLQPHDDLIAAFEVPPPFSPVQPDDPFAQQMQQSSGDQPATQLGGQLAPFTGQLMQPRGQSEEGRSSRHNEKSTGQKKDKKKKKKGPCFLECERVITWGHEKFQEIQVFAAC